MLKNECRRFKKIVIKISHPLNGFSTATIRIKKNIKKLFIQRSEFFIF
jgi:hypothetical protein